MLKKMDLMFKNLLKWPEQQLKKYKVHKDMVIKMVNNHIKIKHKKYNYDFIQLVWFIKRINLFCYLLVIILFNYNLLVMF